MDAEHQSGAGGTGEGGVRTFSLIRNEDIHGISGTGRVAQGVEFDDGTCVLNWTTTHQSTGIYPNIAELEAIHGHEGRTVVVFDEPCEHGYGSGV